MALARLTGASAGLRLHTWQSSNNVTLLGAGLPV
jgi:hypothetical protein